MSGEPKVVTAVVGAGPAGLLFCSTARLLFGRQGGDATAWPIYLFDKRASYQRTHRLRIAQRPLLELQRAIDDRRFDRLISFLEARHFAPAVNHLEERLSELVSDLGVEREHLEIGPGPNRVPLRELRARLEAQGKISSHALLTIVGADSVHSTVRESVRGDRPIIERTHQTVARLRAIGDRLPARFGALEQYRISKVLGSVVDYRLNANGFAEIDLLLPADLYGRLEGLSATPKEPIALTPEVVAGLKAPLFRALVDHFRAGLTPSACEVSLHSTFKLEHRYVEQVVYRLPRQVTDVYLVGDAAVSLPFFRGMACMAGCVLSLARAHCDLVHTAYRSVDVDLEAEVYDMLKAEDRSMRVGPKLMPGRIDSVEHIVLRGAPAVVVLHNWLGRWGVHVLRRERPGVWRSEHHLAPVRAAIARRDFAEQVSPARRYEAEVAKVRRAEIAVVKARARLVRGAREFARVSSLLPFPLQTWFLSIPQGERRPGRMSAGAVLNALLAVAAAVFTLWGPVSGNGSIFYAALAIGLAIQAGGGLAYRAAQELEPGPDTLLRAIWRFQIAAVFVAGAAVGARSLIDADRPTRIGPAALWLMLGGAFIAGMYAYDAIGRRWFAHAQLEDDVRADTSADAAST